MLNNKKVVVVLPAYNAAKTLRRTVEEIPHEIVDEVILTDDASRDNTSALALELGLITIRHDHNRGYGGNQKTCYTAALARGRDIVVMLHPDYQYTPETGFRHGLDDRLRGIRRCSGLAHSRPGSAQGRHARL